MYPLKFSSLYVVVLYLILYFYNNISGKNNLLSEVTLSIQLHTELSGQLELGLETNSPLSQSKVSIRVTGFKTTNTIWRVDKNFKILSILTLFFLLRFTSNVAVKLG